MNRNRRRSTLAGLTGLCLVAGTTALVAPAVQAADDPANFVVVGPRSGSLERTVDSIQGAGGTVLQPWPQVGVVIAESDEPGFAEELRRSPGVSAAGPSRALVERVSPTESFTAEQTKATPAQGDDAAEPLFGLQWDMRMIKADEAHEITDGSSDVVVGILDTGIDDTHPDLDGNVDPSLSVGCTNQGIPDTSRSAWTPTVFGHGTHVAGTVAAERDGQGIIGVAPNVTLASVKVVEDAGFIYPEYAICGFIWAAEHGFEVTNNSYFVDPWFFWCTNDPDQRAGLVAVRRAVEYAADRDVVNVAALGNENRDISKSVVDEGSPDNQEPERREVHGNCRDMPAELRGVVGVSAVGADRVKSSYSNYGVQVTDVTAPGGDLTELQAPEPPAVEGFVLSTWPPNVSPGGPYVYAIGTSMASPHTAGVAALIASAHPDWSGKRIARALDKQADPIACPQPYYDIDDDGQPDANCYGGRPSNSFYGSGLVDALEAVTR